MCQHPEEIVRALRAESGPRFRSGWWIAANEQTGESRPEEHKTINSVIEPMRVSVPGSINLRRSKRVSCLEAARFRTAT